MNFDFNEDQRRLQQEVKRFFSDKSPTDLTRKIMDGAELNPDLWKGLGELGALGIAIPENYGGVGLGHLELCLIAEEAGRSLAPVPLLGSIYLAAELILAAGTEAQKAIWLPKIASGELVATAILDSNQQKLNTSQRLSSSNACLSGKVTAIPNSDIASLAIVYSKGELLAVDLSAAGVQKTKQTSIDMSRPLGALSFEQVKTQTLSNIMKA